MSFWSASSLAKTWEMQSLDNHKWKEYSRKTDIIFHVQESKFFSFVFPFRVTYYINIWYPLMEMSASVYDFYEDDGQNLQAVHLI